MKIENGTYDAAARAAFKKNPNTTISFFLSASLAYYCRYESLLSDECFDKMCKWMLKHYDELEHQHKHLVTKEGLETGSGYYLKDSDYPLIVKVSTEQMISDINLWRTINGTN